MGIDSMRVGGGRCPPLLVGGLLVACLMLICNWWSLSSENIELVRQIDELNEQLKISAEERDQCVTLRGNLEQRYKHAEDEVASLHVRLEQQADLKKRNDDLEDTVNICKSELNKLNATKAVALETSKLEKNKLNTQLDEKINEIGKLQEEIDELKDELDNLKVSCNTTPQKKPPDVLPSARAVINKIQLGPVPESAVTVSLAGLRGLKYHGIPILPKDPPGAVRLSPRFSVTMLKANPSSMSAKQEKNDSNKDVQYNGDIEDKKQGTIDGNKIDN